MKNSLKWLAYSTLFSPVVFMGCVSAKSKWSAGKESLANSGIETVTSSREYGLSQNGSEGIVLPVSFCESIFSEESEVDQAASGTVAEMDLVPINLPSALAMVGGQHPVVGLAQWRVREAYAQLERAQVMWLPSIQPGINFRRRDGNYQAVGGEIVDVNLNSLNYGLGSGAVAAGSPAVPGVMARFHLADAIFLPKVNEKTAWARGHAATATLNQQLLTGALAYCDLLEAYQATEVLRESFHRTEELTKITTEYATAGQGLQSDAERSKTELSLLQLRLLTAQEKQYAASSSLARALSVPMTTKFIPQDVVVLPIEFRHAEIEEGELIAQGLVMRPELKETQALVAAAYAAHQREKYAPFVPSVLLGFSTTSFGGGLGSHAENFAGRYDVDAMMVWETRNLGFGEGAARRERHAQIQQATYDKLRIIDQVAQEIAEAKSQVVIRKQQMAVMQEAIQAAQKSYDLNVERIRQGQGLPIEALQAIQALETSQRSYVKAVVDYNRAQFQLQWALGWQVDSYEIQTPANSADSE